MSDTPILVTRPSGSGVRSGRRDCLHQLEYLVATGLSRESEMNFSARHHCHSTAMPTTKDEDTDENGEEITDERDYLVDRDIIT
jgi:hypothetical protein